MVLDINATIGYSRDLVLFRLSLQVTSGEAIRVRGRNGAGKSTLLSTIAGIRPAVSGDVTVFGIQTRAHQAQRHIGYVTDPPNLFEELSSREHIELATKMWAAAKIPTSGDSVSFALLDGIPNLPAEMLSLGQRKRLGVALSLLHAPELWLLDEPFNGLDMESANLLRAEMGAHLNRGGALLCATHDEGALEGLPSTILDIECAEHISYR